MESGTIQYYPPEGGEETLSGMSPAAIRKLGIKLSFVPEDRLGMGLVAAMGMTDNMMLRGYKRGIPFFTDRRTPKAMAEQLIKELEIVTPGVSTPVGRLSGLGAVGQMLFSYGFLTYLAIILALVLAFFLAKTRKGLNLRAVGESPATADAAGINVTVYKYLATCIGGGISGLGGLFFVMEYSGGTWINNGFGDRGWLAIALVIFALWKPVNAIWGSILFGGLYILYLYIPGLDRGAQEIFKALPYVVTIIVLVFTSLRKKREYQPPASLVLAYFREER